MVGKRPKDRKDSGKTNRTVDVKGAVKTANKRNNPVTPTVTPKESKRNLKHVAGMTSVHS
jgi:hypothetical protein